MTAAGTMVDVVRSEKQPNSWRPGALWLALIVAVVFVLGFQAGKDDWHVGARSGSGASTDASTMVAIHGKQSSGSGGSWSQMKGDQQQKKQSEETSASDWKRQVTFMVIGVMKGGTTSMHAYTMQHPRIIQNHRKELRCFTSYWNASDPFCENYYNVTGLQLHPDSITGDYSPGYIFNFVDALPRIKRSFPWIKIIAVLRNPVDRLFSQHNMDVNHKLLIKGTLVDHDLGNRVVMDLEDLRRHGLLPFFQFQNDANNKGNMTLQDWHSATVNQELFRTFHGSEEESKAWESYFSTTQINRAVVSQGFYSMQLRHWMKVFPMDRFLILKTEALAEPEGLDHAIELFYKHVDLPYVPLLQTERANSGSYVQQMDVMVNETLQKVFAPYNAELESLLGPEWKEPW